MLPSSGLTCCMSTPNRSSRVQGRLRTATWIWAMVGGARALSSLLARVRERVDGRQRSGCVLLATGLGAAASTLGCNAPALGRRRRAAFVAAPPVATARGPCDQALRTLLRRWRWLLAAPPAITPDGKSRALPVRFESTRPVRPGDRSAVV